MKIICKDNIMQYLVMHLRIHNFLCALHTASPACKKGSYPVKTLLQDLPRKGPLSCTPARSCEILQDPVRSFGISQESSSNLVQPSKNRLTRNIHILQVFFCKLCTKNEAFLARYEKSCKKILQDSYFSCKILIISCKKIILQFFLARFLQDFSYLARNTSFLMQDLQDFV